MQITKRHLLAIMPNSANVAEGYIAYINKYAQEFGVNTPLRMAHYLAQVAVESCEMTRVTENLSYSAQRLLQVFPKYFTKQNAQLYAHNPRKIASRVYANRMGNGAEITQDGWKYRGRGFFQLTGKENYRKYDQYLEKSGVHADLLNDPDLLSRPVGAVKSSMWYFQTHGCLEKSDKDDLRGVTLLVNGGLNGYDQRSLFLAKAKKALGVG